MTKKVVPSIVLESPEQPPQLLGNTSLICKLLHAVTPVLFATKYTSESPNVEIDGTPNNNDASNLLIGSCPSLTNPDKALEIPQISDNTLENIAAKIAECFQYDDYLNNLHNSIVVDYFVDVISLCAQYRIQPNRTTAVLQFVNDIRESIVNTRNIEEAQSIFKAFIVLHAGQSIREEREFQFDEGIDVYAGTIGYIASEGEMPQNLLEGQQGTPGTGKSRRKSFAPLASDIPNTRGTPIRGGKEKEGLKSQGKVYPQGTQQTAAHHNAEEVSEPLEDYGPMYLVMPLLNIISHFVAEGVMQHWRLHALVGTRTRQELFVPIRCSGYERNNLNAENGSDSEPIEAYEEPCSSLFILGIQAPLPSHPLSIAISLEQYEKTYSSDAAKARAEQEILQEKERQRLEEERLAEEDAAEKQRLLEEEHNKGLLYLRNGGTEKAVEKLCQSMESELNNQRERIILRIAKLEEALNLVSVPVMNNCLD